MKCKNCNKEIIKCLRIDSIFKGYFHKETNLHYCNITDSKNIDIAEPSFDRVNPYDYNLKHMSIGKKEFWSIDTIGGVIEIETFNNVSKIKIKQDISNNIIRIKLHRNEGD